MICLSLIEDDHAAFDSARGNLSDVFASVTLAQRQQEHYDILNEPIGHLRMIMNWN